MARLTKKQALLLTDMFCFTMVVVIIGTLMYLLTVAILSL